MGEKYLEQLALQYEQATGDKVKFSDKIVFSNDFYNWISDRSNDGLKYLKMLEYLRIDYEEDLLEVGKGKLDTLVKGDYGSIILTPYFDSFYKTDHRRIICGDLFVGKDNNHGTINTKISSPRISLKDFNKVATHNPYDLDGILAWSNLFSSNNQVILGMFGNLEDLDYNKKIEVLENIKRRLSSDEYIERYETVGSTYMYTLVGNKTRKKVK